MINVGILGATGYTGEELLKVILAHPQVKVSYLSDRGRRERPLGEELSFFRHRDDLILSPLEINSIIEKAELVFLALPHTVSMQIVPHLIKAERRVIDLSADYRLHNPSLYKRWYGLEHKDIDNLGYAIYGLPELYRKEIATAQLIANPGCFPTGVILGVAPFLLKGVISNSIIVNAITGLSGAGKKANIGLLFSEVSENLLAYKVNCHQHIPEIEEHLGLLSKAKVKVCFVPHLAPIRRGILFTIYLKKEKDIRARQLLREFYTDELFIRLTDSPAQIRDVLYTNYCDISVAYEDRDEIILISCLDNLAKGAAHQAVQNMNIMYGFPEDMGLGRV